MKTSDSDASVDARSVLGVAAAALFGLVLRAAGFPLVVGRDAVVFAPGDAMYHVRRAYVSFVEFPRVLLWDPYINHPDGAPIPWPPLTDWLYAAVARLVASDQRGFELVMAWGPPLLGALTVVPVFLIARRVTSRAGALGAACLYAAIPVAVQYARVGNPDHHVAVAHLGAWLLFACCVAIGRAISGASLVAPALGLALARVALLLTWHGSLLYLGLVEATLLLASALAGRPALAGAQALSLLVSVALFAPVLATFPTPLLGDYSSIAPSRLHALALLTAASSACALWWGSRRWPHSGPLQRLAAAGAAALGFAMLVIALPGPRAGLAPALQFLGMSDAMGSHTAEQFPLFSVGGRAASARAAEVWGALAWSLPGLPLAALWLARRARAGADAARASAACVLALWSGFFGALALLQIRYGNDAAPAAAVVIAASLAEGVGLAVRRFSLPRALAGALAWGLVALALTVPIRANYAPQLARAWQWLRSEQPAEPHTAAAALHAFLRDVRAGTPETAGYLLSGERPEYGVVAQANLGHAIQWVARRATPTDPFWSYIGPENWDRAFGILTAYDEAHALELARQLRARYVITTPGTDPERLEGRLHAANGSRLGALPALEHFRLIAQGPRGARTLHAIFARDAAGIPEVDIPYKCFEIVEGAVLEVESDSTQPLHIRVWLRAPDGRRFAYERSLLPEAAGTLRVRVPYPSAAEEPYLLSQGELRWQAAVSERALRAGSLIRARPAPAGRDASPN